MSLDIRVVNKHHGARGEYIGRGSPLGNPYPITERDSRERVISRYKGWLRSKINENDRAVIDELNRLAEIAMRGPLRLQCFCAPKPCHGDHIKALLCEAIEGAVQGANVST